MLRLIFSIMVLLSVPAMGQEIDITGPDEPIEPREFVQLWVPGLSSEELPAAKVEYEPTGGVTIFPGQSWGGDPYILFQAKNPGVYTISVSVNGWTASYASAIDGAKQAKNVDAGLLQDMENLHHYIKESHPLKLASKEIVVKGDNPEPKPDPDEDDGDEDDDSDPPEPPPGAKHLVILEESGTRTASQARLYLQLRVDPYLIQAEHNLVIFDKDAKDSTGNADPTVASYTARMDGSFSLPALFIVGDDGTVYWEGDCPETRSEFEAKVKELTE
jgi:hypothetical protein